MCLCVCITEIFVSVGVLDSWFGSKILVSIVEFMIYVWPMHGFWKIRFIGSGRI